MHKVMDAHTRWSLLQLLLETKLLWLIYMAEKNHDIVIAMSSSSRLDTDTSAGLAGGI